MSCDDTPHYEREIFLKNHLEALLKPVVGILSGRNAPSYLRNDRQHGEICVEIVVMLSTSSILSIPLTSNPSGKANAGFTFTFIFT